MGSDSITAFAQSITVDALRAPAWPLGAA